MWDEIATNRTKAELGRERVNILRALREATGYEPLERQQVTSPWRDNGSRALKETTGYEPLIDNRLRALGETTGYEPLNI